MYEVNKCSTVNQIGTFKPTSNVVTEWIQEPRDLNRKQNIRVTFFQVRNLHIIVQILPHGLLVHYFKTN